MFSLEMPPLLYLAIGLVVFVSSVVQGMVGFAANLLTIPLLLIFGIPLPHAVAVCLVMATAQNAVGCVGLREHVPWRRLRRPILIRLATLPVGVGLLAYANNLDLLVVKQIVGVVLLFFVGAQLVSRLPSSEAKKASRGNVNQKWEWLSFGSSGLLQGFCGMAGPPMVVWTLSQRWSADRSRSFLFAMHLSGVVPQGILLYLAFGKEILPTFSASLLLLPVVLLGMLLGIRLGRVLQGHKLAYATHAVLIFVAVSAIIAPWMEPLLGGQGSQGRPRGHEQKRPNVAWGLSRETSSISCQEQFKQKPFLREPCSHG